MRAEAELVYHKSKLNVALQHKKESKAAVVGDQGDGTFVIEKELSNASH
jgi:hypothetical protein